MAATSKLSVWNAALREIAAAPLANTTDTNTRQFELAGAWDHAIEHVLAMHDWGFARRRASLTGVSDTAFPPYTYRFTKPADYLRKCWFKRVADDEHQIDHAEIAAVIYAMDATGLIEYMSDHADNYDPANWPPHFTKLLTLYLAQLVGPRLARMGAGDEGKLAGKMASALDEAEAQESLFLTNVSITAARQPVMRRALEFLGQQLAGSVPVHAHADMLRWHMNRAWTHAVKFVLEQGAWNFASQRLLLQGGLDAASIVPAGPGAGIGEGYSVGPATTTTTPDIAGYEYAYALPTDFLHKIWLKASAASGDEVPHHFVGAFVLCDHDPAVMEYVALNSTTTDPANWSASFLEAVAAYLALIVTPELVLTVNGKGGMKVDASGLRAKLEAMWRDKLTNAQTRDAIQQYPEMMPVGRFVRARMGGVGAWRR